MATLLSSERASRRQKLQSANGASVSEGTLSKHYNVLIVRRDLLFRQDPSVLSEVTGVNVDVSVSPSSHEEGWDGLAENLDDDDFEGLNNVDEGEYISDCA